MKKLNSEWVFSQRDGDFTKLNRDNKPLFLTEKEKEKFKKEIVENHEKLGLDRNLKYELFPELF